MSNVGNVNNIVGCPCRPSMRLGKGKSWLIDSQTDQPDDIDLLDPVCHQFGRNTDKRNLQVWCDDVRTFEGDEDGNDTIFGGNGADTVTVNTGVTDDTLVDCSGCPWSGDDHRRQFDPDC